MHRIVILTQDVKNLSVQMIEAELKGLVGSQYQIIRVPVATTQVTSEGLKILSPNPFHSTIIPHDEIAFVMKRTWGNSRTKALALCRALENRGVKIFNTCDGIEFTHDKIRQYNELKGTGLLPLTVCFDAEFVAARAAFQDHESTLQSVLKKVNEVGLSFPLVFKTAEGCRTDGVWLLANEEELLGLLTQLFSALKNPCPSENTAELTKGFLLQKFIITDEANPNLSRYFRANVVSGKIQSVVQFELEWKAEGCGKRLQEFVGSNNKPIHPSYFSSAMIKTIYDICKNYDTVGLDLLCPKPSEEFLLELNDGPAVSHIVEAADKHRAQNDSSDLMGTATSLCREFPKAIAKACLPLLKPQSQLVSRL